MRKSLIAAAAVLSLVVQAAPAHPIQSEQTGVRTSYQTAAWVDHTRKAEGDDCNA